MRDGNNNNVRLAALSVTNQCCLPRYHVIAFHDVLPRQVVADSSPVWLKYDVNGTRSPVVVKPVSIAA